MKNYKGITLIALIITIIVMLILVAVTINMVAQERLFEITYTAANKTQIEIEKERLLSALAESIDKESNINVIKLKESVEKEEFTVIGDELPLTCVNNNSKNKYIVDSKARIIHVGKGNETIDPPPSTKQKNYLGEELELGDETHKVTIVAYNDLLNLNYNESTNVYLKNLGTNLKAAVDDGKVSAVLKEEGTEGIAVVPTGFTVSEEEGENTISGGLVLKDGTNEFVWITYNDNKLYKEDSLGPLTGKDNSVSLKYFDTQEILNYYYGNNYYNYESDFSYSQDKVDIENSINTYRGFIVGRYETTLENGTVGVKKNAKVLTAKSTLKSGTNPVSHMKYFYRWWGIYKAEKDLYSSSQSVFSRMITSKEWTTMIQFTGYGSTKRKTDTYTTKPDLSGAKYKGVEPEQYDISKNIYDLAGNLNELTLTENDKTSRYYRGGAYAWQYSEDSDTAGGKGAMSPTSSVEEKGSRVVLHIY